MPYSCTNCNKICVTRSELMVHSGKCGGKLLQCGSSYSVKSEVSVTKNDRTFDEKNPATGVISMPHNTLMCKPSTSRLNSTYEPQVNIIILLT